MPGAKTARTRYRTLTSHGRLSLVECELLTGRTHQIRAHMASIGCPLLGDGKYGTNELNRPYGETGQALYAYSLTFRFAQDAGALQYSVREEVFSEFQAVSNGKRRMNATVSFRQKKTLSHRSAFSFMRFSYRPAGHQSLLRRYVPLRRSPHRKRRSCRHRYDRYTEPS